MRFLEYVLREAGRRNQEVHMRKTAVLAGLVTAAVVGIGAVVYAQPYGPGWMGGGYGPGWMTQEGYGPGYGPGMMRGSGWGGSYAPGWMHGWMRGGYGPGWMHGGYGQVSGRDLNLTAEDVKGYIEQTIRNPRLKVGDVKQTDDNSITADIVTKDKEGLVQRFVINRHTGLWRPQSD
jgi:hypothetical protein